MLFHQKVFIDDSYGGDFFVIAGDNATQVLYFFEGNHYVCETGGKFVLTFPSPASGDLSGLDHLFYAVWRAGKTDIVVVLSDWRCRIFSYVPIKGEDNYIRSTTSILVHSQTGNSSCPFNESAVTYFLNTKISNLHQSIIDVMAPRMYSFYDPLMDFLEVAMNASFNRSHTLENLDETVDIFSSLPIIKDSIFWANPEGGQNFILPSFIEIDEVVFAVPRKLIYSVVWLRLINEFSDYVWYGLIISLILSVGVFYLHRPSKGLIYVVMFTVQPLFETSWSAHYLSWRGRVFFILWLFSCFVLTSSYLCTLHSELTVPNTEDAIKSFDDLVKSNLPVHVLMAPALRQIYDASSYFKQVKHKIVEVDITKIRPSYFFIQKNRRDIAYILPKGRAAETLGDMPYRLLPNVICTFISIPVRMTRPSPYQEIFEMAVMRSLAAGALDKVSKEYRRRNYLRLFESSVLETEKREKSLSLDSFDAMFVVWFSGCGIACLVLVIECRFKQIRRCIIKKLGTPR